MIRITRLTDYGIVLLTRFAQAEAGAVLSAPDLSRRTGIPLPTVSKILKALGKAGLLRSHRGTQGGYALAESAEGISVGRIIRALEGPIGLTDCASDDGPPCEIEPSCPARHNWARITGAIQDALDAIPLAEMAAPMPFAWAGARNRPGREA
jgi:FeS assembly SUF system regulator